MTPEEQALAQSLPLNFEGVDEAVNTQFTQPGTIAMFIITDCEFITAKTEKATPGLKCTFTEIGGEETVFSHSFWLTANSLTRIQTLATHALKEKLVGQINPAGLVARFKGKQLPLKVIAQINETKGRAYAGLSYADFSAEKIEELKFNAKEIADIERGKALVAQTNIQNADTDTTASAPTGATPGSTQAADDF